jgi:hypothetical protein
MASSTSDVLTVRALRVALRGRMDASVDVDEVVAAAYGHAPVLARALGRVCDPRITSLSPTTDRAAILLRAALDRAAGPPIRVEHNP